MLQDSRFIKIKNVLTKKVIMKKVSKISLYNLSKVGLSDKEMSMINGGYNGPKLCWAICLDAVCRCVEDGYGEFSTSAGVTQDHSNSKVEQNALDEHFKKNPSYI